MLIGKLVSVRGTVVKVSIVRPLVVQMDFLCAKCRAIITRTFLDGKYSPPSICTFLSCKGKNFSPIRSTACPIDFQKIRHVYFCLSVCIKNLYHFIPPWYNFYFDRVQELLGSENHEQGRVPRTVDCELTEDLVDSCIPGNVVTVTGIIKVINNYMDVGGGMLKHKVLYNIIYAAHFINKRKKKGYIGFTNCFFRLYQLLLVASLVSS